MNNELVTKQLAMRSLVRMSKKPLTAMGLAGLCSLASVASALTINIIDTGASPMTAQQLEVVQAAANVWESRFADPITVNINVAWTPPGNLPSENIIADTASARMKYGLYQVTTAMKLDADTNAEENAVSLIQSPTTVVAINGTRDERDVIIPMANAKALGLSTGQSSLFGNPLPNNADATIRINNGLLPNLDMDRSDGIDPNQFDAVGVIAHEIGHALGFVSTTDWQDANPGIDISPSILDVWRFFETGGWHDISDDGRAMKTSAAEYFDSVQNNIGFSQGVLTVDPLCQTTDGLCQAQHWRDNLSHLMVATAGPGESLGITDEDIQALDFIGYNRRAFIPLPALPITHFLLRFEALNCKACISRLQSKLSSRYPKTPDLKTLKPPFKGANLAMQVELNTKVKGVVRRSGMGLARFERAVRNRDQSVLRPPKTPIGKGAWEGIAPIKVPMRVIPARLTGFYFESDELNGPKFSFNAVLPRQGAQFNPQLGNFGGFRIGGFVDAAADKNTGDADGSMVVELHLANPVDINTGITKATFTIKVGTKDNRFTVRDHTAFGLPIPDRDRDGIEDSRDNCPTVYNPEQLEGSTYGVGKSCE